MSDGPNGLNDRPNRMYTLLLGAAVGGRLMAYKFFFVATLKEEVLRPES